MKIFFTRATFQTIELENCEIDPRKALDFWRCLENENFSKFHICRKWAHHREQKLTMGNNIPDPHFLSLLLFLIWRTLTRSFEWAINCVSVLLRNLCIFDLENPIFDRKVRHPQKSDFRNRKCVGCVAVYPRNILLVRNRSENCILIR